MLHLPRMLQLLTFWVNILELTENMQLVDFQTSLRCTENHFFLFALHFLFLFRYWQSGQGKNKNPDRFFEPLSNFNRI